jgi:hypothetical protein
MARTEAECCAFGDEWAFKSLFTRLPDEPVGDL